MRIPLMVFSLLLPLVPGTGYSAERVPDLQLRSLVAVPATTLHRLLAQRPAILVFWRSDCPPCLEELQGLKALEKSAGSTPLLAIGLEPAPALRAMIDKMGLEPRDSWQTDADPAEVLVRFGSNPPRLPLSVMLDDEGKVCAKRIGRLGPALLTEWVAQCASRPSTGD